MNYFYLHLCICIRQFPKNSDMYLPFSNYATIAILDLCFCICIKKFPKYKQTKICVYFSASIYISVKPFLKNMMCEDKCNMCLQLNITFGSVTIAYLWSLSSLRKNFAHPKYRFPLFHCIFLLFIFDCTVHCGSTS